MKVVANERLRAQRICEAGPWRTWPEGNLDAGIEIGERQVAVTRHLVSRWERGITMPRAPYPKLLCRLFQTTAEELGLVGPFRQVPASVTMQGSTIEDRDDVERREFLDLFSSAAKAAAVWAVLPPGVRSHAVSSATLPICTRTAPLRP